MSIIKDRYTDLDGDDLTITVKLNDYAINEFPDWFEFDFTNWIIKIEPEIS